MKNNAEAMPLPAQEPKKPFVQEEDVEQLMKAFEEADKEKAAAEPTFEDLLAEAEESMNKDIEAEKLKSLRDEANEKMKRHESLLPGIEAKRFAPIILDQHADVALSMADREEDAATLLLDPIRQELWKIYDPNGETRKLAEHNTALQSMIETYAAGVRSAAKHGMAEELKSRLDAAEDPADISKYHKLLEIVEKSD